MTEFQCEIRRERIADDDNRYVYRHKLSHVLRAFVIMNVKLQIERLISELLRSSSRRMKPTTSFHSLFHYLSHSCLHLYFSIVEKDLRRVDSFFLLAWTDQHFWNSLSDDMHLFLVYIRCRITRWRHPYLHNLPMHRHRSLRFKP